MEPVEVKSETIVEEEKVRRLTITEDPVKIGDPEKRRRYLVSANKRLRRCIKRLSERQEVLEEIVEIHHGREAIERCVENKKRLLIAFGFTDGDLEADSKEAKGKRAKVTKHLRLINSYWNDQRINFGKPTSFHQKKQYEMKRPGQLMQLRLTVTYDTGLIGRMPKKMCHRCFDGDHKMRACQYKKEASRTPEIVAQIAARREKYKEEVCADPLVFDYFKRKFDKYDKTGAGGGKRKAGEDSDMESDPDYE